MHARAQLRNAVAAALGVGAVPLLGGRVYTGRAWPSAQGQMPDGRVYTDQEQIGAAMGQEARLRDITVRVEIRAQGIDGSIDDDIDDACEQVESALAGPLTVAGRPVRALYQGTEIEYDPTGEYTTARATLTYLAQIVTLSETPGSLA